MLTPTFNIYANVKYFFNLIVISYNNINNRSFY